MTKKGEFLWRAFSWKKELRESFFIFLFGGVFQIVVWSDFSRLSLENFTVSFVYSGIFWIMLWKGSEHMVTLMDSIYSWFHHPVRRLILSVVSLFVYTAFVVYFLDFVFDFFVFGKSFSESIEQLNGSSLTTVLFVNLGINTFMHGRGFLLEWRQMSIDMEKLKTEQVFTQFQSLKNQVNPHFLFNSLNALSSLVYDDQDKAVEFIRKLSQVYRYVLDRKDDEVVPLNDELEFLHNFIFLQKIRFGDNLIVEVSGQNQSGYLPPLALQLLVENAIKHNVISEQYPLRIEIVIDEDYCRVVNNIKEKLEKDSTGIGLSNLRDRYGYLSDKEMIIENDGQQFTVKIPVLNLEK